MARELEFEIKFPEWHPKAGAPTHFIETLWSGWADSDLLMDDIDFSNVDFDWYKYYNGRPKWLTIQPIDSWKVGELFSPVVYHNNIKTVIGPDIEIKHTWRFDLYEIREPGYGGIDANIDTCGITDRDLMRLAINFGLDIEDFKGFFKVTPENTFHGEIICWNKDIKYP